MAYGALLITAAPAASRLSPPRRFATVPGVKRFLQRSVSAQFAVAAWLACLVASGAGQTAEAPPPTPAYVPKPPRLPGDEIFEQPTVLDFQIQLGRTNLNALREHPREYTAATVTVNGQTFTNVALKLKGAAGSFRAVDDRPAMTLHFSKWASGRRLFGIRRLHLNNSVQDGSYLNEYIGSELFRAAGVPTPRVAWATVRLEDSPLGLYVLKEAFETEFLRSFFGSADGNLYDGGFVRDIDQDLNRESGKGPDDQSDLKRLLRAAQVQDPTERWERLNEVLDVDKFATYAALSVMLVDWDGYPLNRNNYRVYFRPDDGRAVFLPHGMDQLFQRSYLELDAGWNGLVAWSLFSTPKGQALYEARCREVFTNVFRLERITNAIARVSAVLTAVEPDFTNRAASLEYQVDSRFRVLRRDGLLKPPSPPK